MSQVVQDSELLEFTGEGFTPPFSVEHGNGLSILISGERKSGLDDLDYELLGYLRKKDGSKAWVALDKDTLTPDTINTPEGALSNRVSQVVQDAYGRYDGIVLRFSTDATYDIFVSVRRFGAGYRGI